MIFDTERARRVKYELNQSRCWWSRGSRPRTCSVYAL